MLCELIRVDKCSLKFVGENFVRGLNKESYNNSYASTLNRSSKTIWLLNLKESLEEKTANFEFFISMESAFTFFSMMKNNR